MPPKKQVERKPPIRIHVGVPTYSSTPAICMLSFGSLIGSGAGLIHRLGQVDGAYIDRSRNDLVRQAITNDATHILFIDQDMIVPEGSLQRLLGHKKQIVGATYFGKDDFFTPVAFHLDPFRRVYEFEDLPYAKTPADELPEGNPNLPPLVCVCGKPDNHIHEVGGTGMGLTLLKVSLCKKMRQHFGDELWFSSKETGEDVHFALRCAEMGVTRYIDGFIHCGHVRNQIVTFQHYEWAKKSAPKCDVEGCGRTAQWNVEDADTAETATRCWQHRADD